MNHKQPNNREKAKGQWQRKLSAAFVAASLLWLPAKSALAAITDTVTATGFNGATPLTSSATANVIVVPANPQFSVIKTPTPNYGPDGSPDPGDTISYTFTIQNTGNITLQNVTINDPMAILTGAPIPSLAPGVVDTLTYSAVHTITPADLTAGQFTNTATGTAHALSGQDLTTIATVTTPLTVTSAMTFVKTGTLNMGVNGQADAGDTIAYQFVVTNTGPTTIHGVSIDDPLVNGASLGNDTRAIAMLEGAKQASDELTTASIDAPRQCLASNNLSNDVTSALNGEVGSIDEASLNIDRQLVRMSGEGDQLVEGDKIGFIYRLINTGNTPLTSIVVDQPDATAFNGRVELLAPNETDAAAVIYTRAVTAEEIAVGEIIAPATLTAKSHLRNLAMNIASKLPLSDLKAYDAFTTASITPSVPQTLTPGQSFTFNATYILKQSDVDNGFVNNTATATALNTANQTLTKTSSFSQPLVAVPSIATIKTGTIAIGADNQASIGDIITYHFAVTNTGNVTLSNVAVTDPKAVFSPLTTIATLAPGATDTTTFVATHSLTAADLVAGQYQNQATANAKTPKNVAITPTLSDNDADHTTLDPTIVQWPAIALIKTVTSVNDVNGNGFTDANDTISYGFKVINTGKFTINNITITDPLMPTGILGAPLNGLAPGASDSTHFTGLYTIKQSDVNLGHVDNTAKVEGTDTNGVKVVDFSDPGVPTADSPTITPIPPHPVLTLVKLQLPVEDKNNNGLTDVGDVIHYTFQITNAGNLPFTTVNLVDLLPGAVVTGTTLTNFAPTAQDSTTFTASYTITSTDVALGSVVNQAKVTGTLASGGVVTDLSDNADPNGNNPTVTPIIAKPSIALIKHFFSIVDNGTIGVTDAGDVINFTFDVKNTGNVPLSNVQVNDLLAGAVVTGGPIANLPAGNTDTTTFKASYTITPADVTNGKVSNSAQAFGTYNATTVSDFSDNALFTADNPTVTTLGAGIAIVKVFAGFTDVNTNGITDANDIANYTFAVTNLGSGAINNLIVTDPNANVFGGGLPNGVLLNLPASSTNSAFFTATHTVTPADLSAGGIYNTAKVQGTSVLTGNPVTDVSDPASKFSDGPTYAPILGASGIALIKKMATFDDLNGSGIVDVGDVLHYTFEVRNTGNTDLINVQISDLLPGIVLVGSPIASLPAGTINSFSVTGTYTVKVSDATAGLVSNTATVHADVTTGGFVEDTSDPVSSTGNGPTITPVFITIPVLTKVADKPEVKRGEIVTYTITASNLVPTPFELVDVMPPGFAYVAGSAFINGNPATPVINVRNLDFPPTMPVAGKLILKLKLMASTTLSTGKFVNNAQILNPITGELLATAQATVSIIEDSTFDCSDIIGRVFDDKNANGYMDDGEPGLPGIRVVTLNGLLITTDAEGRYHVPCAAIPDAAIGSNFLLKLDVRSLPAGYKLTTENPRDVRVTRGKVVKLNFGATIDHEVRLDITAKAFVGGSLDLSDKWIGGIDKLLGVLANQKSSLKIVYHLKGEDPDLGRARAAAIAETITTAWQADQGKYKLVTTTSVEVGK